VHDQGMELRRLSDIVAKLDTPAAAEPAADDDPNVDDGQLEYELTESLWEAPLVVSALPIGMAGATFAWLLVLFNVVLQAVLVYIIGALLTAEVMTDETVAEYASWRRTSAHDVRYMEELTETSMASLVCRGSGRLVQSAIQVQAHDELLGYLGSATNFADSAERSVSPGAFMCLIALLVWSLVCSQDITKAVQLVRIVLALPTGPTSFLKTGGGALQIASFIAC